MALKIRPKKQVKAESAMHEKCAIGECMALLGGAWTPNLIWNLTDGPRRFSELKIYLKPISSKMLSQRLKDLEEKGVISRAVKDTSPPSVEYELSELGRELLPAIIQIAKVGAKLKTKQNDVV